jgi:hypothetical protein
MFTAMTILVALIVVGLQVAIGMGGESLPAWPG